MAGALFTDLSELTMSASYLELGLDGDATFELFVRSLPDERRFLVACGLAEGRFVTGVRLDGDLVALSRAVRAGIDEAGCTEVRILVSGDLDEHVIADLRAAGAPVDAFGVGTRLGTSADVPALGVIDKLVARGRRLVRPPLAEARERCAAAVASLPSALRGLDAEPVPPYPVGLSPGLRSLAEAVSGPLGRSVVGEERHG